jgi:hypothetical protein
VGIVIGHDGLPGKGDARAARPPVRRSRKDTRTTPGASGRPVSRGGRRHGDAVIVRIMLPLSATSNSGR